jgi:hypothetical protein
MGQWVLLLIRAAKARDWVAVDLLLTVSKQWEMDVRGAKTEFAGHIADLKALNIVWWMTIGKDPFRKSHDLFLQVLTNPALTAYL